MFNKSNSKNKTFLSERINLSQCVAWFWSHLLLRRVARLLSYRIYSYCTTYVRKAYVISFYIASLSLLAA
jgi:hypothetical protein